VVVEKYRASWLTIVVAVAFAGCVPPQPGLRDAKGPRFGHLQTGYRALRIDPEITVFDENNGLTVALMPDTRTNLVSVDVRYLVGSAEDPAGHAGLAHLVEHLTFLARTDAGGGGPTIGDQLADATLGYNAFTSPDETHYTSTALADQLDTLLAIEARRMQIGCDQIRDELFARERDVVLAEEAQRAGKYLALRNALAADLWGARHPYGRPQGTNEVATASRDDACAFIAHHYGPDRAILVVTGKFATADVRAAIDRHFGSITSHVTGTRVAIAPATLRGTTTTHTADVEEATAVVYYAAPTWGSTDAVSNEMLRDVLRRQMRDLDDAEDWITDGDAFIGGDGAARVLGVSVSVSDPRRLDEAVRRVQATVQKAPGEVSERIDVLRSQARERYVESFDSFDNTGMWLADFLQYTRHRRFFVAELEELDTIDAARVTTYARSVLMPEYSHAIKVRPTGKKAHARRAPIESERREHDVQPWRTPVDAADAKRPLVATQSRVAADVRDFELGNGLRVLLAPDPGGTLVDARLVFPIGSASDPTDRRGLARLAAMLLDHDGRRLYRREDAELLNWSNRLGTQLDYDVDERATVFSSRGPATFADWHVWRLFWLLDDGVYDSADFDKLHKRVAARDRVRDRTDPGERRATALRQTLFGKAHPYAAPPVDAAALQKIELPQLRAFNRAHYHARGATLIVAGGFDPVAMRAEIEELFGAWSGDAPETAATVPAVRPVHGPNWIGVTDPDAAQVTMTIAFGTTSDPQQRRAARLVLGAMLEDRVRIVREGLAASYSVSVGYASGLGGGVLSVDADVEPDRAGKALKALVDELAAVRGGAGTLAEDFVRARRRAVARVLADSSGASDLAGELEFVAARALPLSFFSDLARDVGRVSLEDIAALAAADLQEDRMVVALSGPRAAVEAAFAAAGVTPRWLDDAR